MQSIAPVEWGRRYNTESVSQTVLFGKHNFLRQHLLWYWGLLLPQYMVCCLMLVRHYFVLHSFRREI